MKKLFFISFLIIPLAFLAQTKEEKEEEKNKIIEQRIEYILEGTDVTDADFTTLFDQLSFFYEHPINLNRTDKDELNSLGLLTDIQILNLLQHIEKNGKLLTLEELQSIDGFDLETIYLILPFVKVTHDIDAPKITFRELLDNGQNNLFIRYQQVIEEKKGFSPIDDSTFAANPNARYLGAPYKLYTRYKFNYGTHLSMGVTAEKDAGEEFFKGSNSSFDFYSAHFFLRNQGKIKRLAIGDYQAEFGQGLTMWSGLAFGKTADPMLIKRNAQFLKPYTSVDENRFLRGAGTTVKFDNIELTGFYSSNKIDGNISIADSTVTDVEALVVSSIQQTGFHRTPNELIDKDAITQQVIGGHITFVQQNLNIGITGINSQLDVDFQPSLQPYSQFRNTSNNQTNVGLDYNWIYQNFNFFGEVSQSLDAGYAYTTGALIALDPRLNMSVLYRNFERDFHPIMSNALGENSTNENEKGLYIGIQAKPYRKFTLSGYFDQFQFPWLKYQIDAPSKGYQYLAQLNYTPSKKLDIYFRIRERRRNKNTPLEVPGIDYIVGENQANYRFNFDYKVSDAIRLKSRVEMIEYELKGNNIERGYLVYQDIIFKPLSKPYSFAFRYAMFDTDSYNARIYAYENDVLYAFSIPAYYNRGTRTYLTFRYKIRKGIDVWLRYATTIYNNVDVISSGLEEIKGNTKSEVKAQLRFKF
ncbi:MAG: helix-hairpin-helix domain-containing protein [Vicingaceae bacterium]